MSETPTHDSKLARFSRAGHPGKGFCLRCGYPWGVVKEHVTHYTESTGCFPLCEGCWTELGHPEARIEYYQKLIDLWASRETYISDDEKNDIARAVANGG